MVIDNDLHRRKFEVIFVYEKSPSMFFEEKTQQQPSTNLSVSFELVAKRAQRIKNTW